MPPTQQEVKVRKTGTWQGLGLGVYENHIIAWSLGVNGAAAAGPSQAMPTSQVAGAGGALRSEEGSRSGEQARPGPCFLSSLSSVSWSMCGMFP